MNRLVVRLLLTFFLLTSLSIHAQERYALNAGDVLSISVWNEESLQKQVVVLPDGVITFPLAGEVVAQNKTIIQVQTELRQKLTEYLADPVVTVSVVAVEGNRIHILGKVTNPGSFMMSKPLDSIQALSLAGGLSPYAEENNIIVLRRSQDKQQVFSVKYADIKKGKALDSNIILQSGDVMMVP